MRSPLLAGLISTLVAIPALAAPLESPWTASIAAGPVTVQSPSIGSGVDDGEFTARVAFGRKVSPAWEGGLEAGYLRFGRQEGGVGYMLPESAGKSLDSYDLTLFARFHPKVGGHPYFVAGTGAYAVYGFFPKADPNRLSRQIKPAITFGAGLHGLLLPALGFELRWVTIYEGGGPGREPKRDVLSALFTLTKE